MATLTIRNMPDELVRLLDIQAAEAGCSREGYLRMQLARLADPAPRPVALLRGWVRAQ